MSLINKEKLLLDFIKEKFALPNFYFVDIGVSGGFHDIWRSFGENLVALGVDVLENEINRLIKQETLGNVMYISAFCGSGNKQEQHKNVESNYPLHKTLAYLTTSLFSLNKIKISRDEYLRIRNQIISGNLYKIPKEANFSNVPQPEQDPFVSFYVKRFNNHNSSIQKSANIQTVDNLVKKVKKFNRIDLLKIDVDGPDFDILLALESRLEDLKVLGFKLEVNFNGSSDPYDHTFHNMDRLMRKNGFDLYDLSLRRYTKSALPGIFEYNFFGQTVTGAQAQGDALYFKN